MRWVAAILMILMMTAVAAPRAARASEADELIRQGVALRRTGDDAGALRRFEQAYQLEHGSRALAQIGLAEQALGRWSSAYDHLQQALEDGRDPWIKKSAATLHQALDLVSDHVGHLEVLGGSPDAEVRIDGVARGKLPLARALTVSAGTVTVELVAPRFIPVQRTTVVRARQTVRESFDPLVATFVANAGPRPAGADAPPPEGRHAAPRPASPAPPPPAEAEARPVPVEPPRGSVPPVVEKQKDKDSADAPGSSSFRPALKWIAWGTGAAALGLGIVGMVRQDHAGNDFDASCGVGPGQTVVPLPGSNRSASDCRGFKDRVDSNYRLELIGYVAAGALAVTGLVLWLTEPSARGGESAALACSPGVTVGGAQLGCALRF